MPRRRAARGFSLIELLIVVAIIAALVGVAVPFFQDNLSEAQRTKAREDLEIIRRAIERYEALESKPLTGTSLGPLEGRYLQEVPQDPWGNDYLWDGACGVLLSFGADGLPGGAGGDTDVIRFDEPLTNPTGNPLHSMPVFMNRAQYQGPWGPPVPPPIDGFLPDFSRFDAGNKLIVGFSRSVEEVSPALVPSVREIYPDGSFHASARLDGTSWAANTWKSAADAMFAGTGVDPLHRPELGQIVVRSTQDNRSAAGGPYLAVRPQVRVGLEVTSLDTALRTSWTMNATPASPVDDTVYGAEATRYRPLLFPPPVTHEGNLDGVRLERY